MPWLDLTEPLQQAVQNRGMPFAPGDSHWGPEGHALAAQLIREELQTRGWLRPVNKGP
jgi:hypothetical protein